MKKPLKIAITGAAGQIAYQLLFRLASGQLFGADQPLIFSLLETPSALPFLEGVKMELDDCAFPLLQAIRMSSDPFKAFEECEIALLIGSKPRGPGMERQELLQENGKIFIEQGKALNQCAHRNVKVFVVGNPCNTNCLIALSHAPNLKRENFFAMTRLDQNRAAHFLAVKANVSITAISNIIIWGNHSSTQVPDFTHALIQNKPVTELIQDHSWLKKEFMDLVRKRGASIIEKRGKSSAASAANALIDAISDVMLSSSKQIFSTGIISDNNPYGITDNLIFSFPCIAMDTCKIKSGFTSSEFIDQLIKLSEKELLEERDAIKSLMN